MCLMLTLSSDLLFKMEVDEVVKVGIKIFDLIYEGSPESLFIGVRNSKSAVRQETLSIYVEVLQ